MVNAVLACFPEREIEDVKVLAGRSHVNYAFTFADGGAGVLCREQQNPVPHLDAYFGGESSLRRQLAVLGLLREAGIPVPDVYQGDESAPRPYALLSYLNGVTFAEYMKSRQHHLPDFFNALRNLGHTLSATRSILFDRFGDIQPDGIGNGSTSLAERVAHIFERHWSHARLTTYFTEDEQVELRAWVRASVDGLRHWIAAPHLVVYDQHSRSLLVDPSTGKVSGIFDVEFAQAGPAELEVACASMQLFGLYGRNQFAAARAAFLEGYGAVASGPEGVVLEQCFMLNHFLSATLNLYDGVVDGIRDEWSQAFARAALDVIRGSYDPAVLENLKRAVTGFPSFD